MITTLVSFYLAIVSLDVVLTMDLRCLVYSFLLSKRNLRGAKKIHRKQSKKDKLTLSYIGNHSIYPKQFHFFQKCWIWHILSIIPKYLAIAIVNLFSVLSTIILIAVFFIIEMLFYAIIVRSQFSGRITRFDKRY